MIYYFTYLLLTSPYIITYDSILCTNMFNKLSFWSIHTEIYHTDLTPLIFHLLTPSPQFLHWAIKGHYMDIKLESIWFRPISFFKGHLIFMRKCSKIDNGSWSIFVSSNLGLNYFGGKSKAEQIYMVYKHCAAIHVRTHILTYVDLRRDWRRKTKCLWCAF